MLVRGADTDMSVCVLRRAGMEMRLYRVCVYEGADMEKRVCVLRGRGAGMEMSVCVEGEVLVHVCVLRESADLKLRMGVLWSGV